MKARRTGEHWRRVIGRAEIHVNFSPTPGE
jgi:hypothetical protein